MRLLLALFLLCAAPLQAQTLVLVSATDSVKRFLAARWDDSVNPGQDEKAYCAPFVFALGRNAEPFVILIGIDSAATVTATARGVSFNCPSGTIGIHTHPPSSPVGGGYAFGGLDANICGPSVPDLESLKRNKQLIGIIVCDRTALVGYSLHAIWPKLP